MMKTRISFVLLCTLAIFLFLNIHTNATAKPAIKIGIVSDGTFHRFPKTIPLFKQEITELAGNEFDVRFPPERQLNGNWSISGINSAIDQLLKSPDVDLVIALGHVASHLAAQRTKLAKPIIAPFVFDADVQRLPFKKGSSGVANLNYIDSYNRLEEEIAAFQQITSFKHLAVITDQLFMDTVPGARKRVSEASGKLGISIKAVPISKSVVAALQSIDKNVEAVMIAPLLRLSNADFNKLVDGLIVLGLPSYSVWGRNDVQQGILATKLPEATIQHIARNVAVNVFEILHGKNAGSLNVSFDLGQQLAINMTTARAIGFSPGWDILTQADLLYEKEIETGALLTLQKAVQEAIKANLDLAAANRNVKAGAQQVLEARSELLPQIGVATGQTTIDSDRATSLTGAQPENTWTGTATGSLLLYSDDVWTNYTVEKHQQTSRQEERQTTMLDVMQAASTSYLDVLRTKTIERIQKDNLKLTRANLKRARIRVKVGSAGPAEVYRWESEIAQSRQDVLVSESASRDAMHAVNRIRHRPLMERFIAKEEKLSDPLGMIKDRKMLEYLNNQKKFDVLNDFLISEGLTFSPELKQFDAAIAAQLRIFDSSKRALWLPTLSMQAEVEELFDSSGDGTRPPNSERDDTDWSVGVFATFPLYSGGGKISTKRRAREELKRLEISRQAFAERIEERILNSVNLVRASYPAIKLSRDASQAAGKNLQLVIDSYERGVLSIIDLLDAQNFALVTDQRAANAVYDFLINLMTLQRAVGRFNFFMPEKERQQWRQEMTDYFKHAGIKIK